MKIKVDLHAIYNSSDKVERAIDEAMKKAQDKRIKLIEIIPGKGSGQLKKHILRFLEKEYKNIYHRIEKDDKNWGRIFVHFRWN